MKRTIGRDNVGAGDKMQITMETYNRSTHDIGYIWKSTQAPGTLVPFLIEPVTPGTTLEINLNTRINTLPTVGPVFGSMKAQYDIYICPVRNFQPKLQNNTLNIGRKMDVTYEPEITLYAPTWGVPATAPNDLDNCQINPSSILSYLGIRGVGNPGLAAVAPQREFNASPWLHYWDIYKNYYANKQEGIGAVIHTQVFTPITTVDGIDYTSPLGTDTTIPQQSTGTSISLTIEYGGKLKIGYTGAIPNINAIMLITDTGAKVSIGEIGTITNQGTSGGNPMLVTINPFVLRTIANWSYAQNNDPRVMPINVETFDLANLDKMRENVLGWVLQPTPFNVNIRMSDVAPYHWILNASANNQGSLLYSQEGLAVKCYQNDLFNNWLDSEWIEEINEATAINVAGGSFTMDQWILGKKMFDQMNRIAVAGDSYDDYLDAVYTHERKWLSNKPMYVGGLSKEIVFQEVVSNSESINQPLGSLAGTGRFNDKHKGGHIIVKADEHSYVIGITSFTPRIDYSQGNRWFTGLRAIGDWHTPGLDAIGFQDDINEQRHALSTRWDEANSTWIQTSAGKLPPWINYMTNVNRTYGDFAIENNSMFMTFNRRYELLFNTGDILDLTTYIDPGKYNYIFAYTALDAQNYWHQIAVDIERRALMSARQMPHIM